MVATGEELVSGPTPEAFFDNSIFRTGEPCRAAAPHDEAREYIVRNRSLDKRGAANRGCSRLFRRLLFPLRSMPAKKPAAGKVARPINTDTFLRASADMAL